MFKFGYICYQLQKKGILLGQCSLFVPRVLFEYMLTLPTVYNMT